MPALAGTASAPRDVVVVLVSELGSVLIAILAERPGLSARDLVAEVERLREWDLSRSDVNSALYRYRSMFRREGDSPPEWFVSDDALEFADRLVLLQLRVERLERIVAEHESRIADLVAQIELPKDHAPLRPLRRWQREALAAWRDQGGCGIVEAVTGTGKTRVALEAIADAHRQGLRSLVLVPSIVLQEQWNRVIAEELGLTDVALIGGRAKGSIDPACAVTIGVVNSLSRRWSDLDGQFDLLVGDECHRYGAPAFCQALLPSARLRLGLTATLERNDDAVDDVLIPYFGNPCYRYGFARARAEGVIAPFYVLTIGVDLGFDDRQQYDDAGRRMAQATKKLVEDHGCPEAPIGSFLKSVNRFAGGWGEPKWLANAYLAGLKQRRQILAESPEKRRVLENLAVAIRASRHSVVFTETIEAAEAIADLLSFEDVRCRPYHSGRDSDECREALVAFENGELECLVAVRSLDEGVDVPAINLGIVAAATQQRRQMVQRMGRVVRWKADGRGAAFIVVYAIDTAEDPFSKEPGDGHFAELLAHAEDVVQMVGADIDAARAERLISEWVSS